MGYAASSGFSARNGDRAGVAGWAVDGYGALILRTQFGDCTRCTHLTSGFVTVRVLLQLMAYTQSTQNARNVPVGFAPALFAVGPAPLAL